MGVIAPSEETFTIAPDRRDRIAGRSPESSSCPAAATEARASRRNPHSVEQATRLRELPLSHVVVAREPGELGELDANCRLVETGPRFCDQRERPSESLLRASARDVSAAVEQHA